MRRKHRIIILAALIVIVVVGGGGAVLFRQQMLDSRAVESKEIGMASAEAGNYNDALHQIGRFIQRYGQDEDPEALFEYARARRHIPLPNNKHIGQAIGLFLQVLSFKPDHERAQLELLDLYGLAGYGQETLDLAQDILERDPENVAALSAEARALARLRRFDEALDRARRITELAPGNIENHLLVLGLMETASVPNAEMLAYADAQNALDPDETAYHVIRAVASQLAGQRGEAVEWAKRAGESVPPGSEEILLVNNVLNRFGLFRESLAMLARTAPGSDDPALLQQYCRRLFEAGDTAEVLAQTGEREAATMDSELLALRAMAAGREGDKRAIAEIVQELEARPDDTVADAWAPLLRALWVAEGVPPQEIVEIGAAAVEADQGNPYFHYFQGLAYEQLGENEQAVKSWQNARQAAPAWVDPILRSAGLLAGIERYAEASRLVRQALERAPQNVSVAAMGAEILGADIGGLTENNREQLLKLCEQVQTARPMEPRTLPILVDLRARRGDTAAATDAIQQALAGENELPESTLLKLAQVSDEQGLDLAGACFEKLNATAGQTPAVAFAQATSQLRKGEPERGRELLEKAAAEAGNGLPWQIATAQFLELSSVEDATPIWATIAERAEDNAALLRRVLDSRGAWQDTELIARVIERLKAITGESAIAWRAAKARLLLMTDSSEKAAAEAASLLNDTMRTSLPEARRYTLLATALERLNNTQGAIDCLERAIQIAPESTDIRFELIRMLAARGNTDQASTHLQQIIDDESTSTNDLRRSAALLAQQGQLQRAIDVLTRAHGEDDGKAPLDLLLAQLYRRAQQFENAEAICRRFLQEEPNARVIEFTADMLASQGKMDEARSVLEKLDTLEDAPPGMREMILAEFNRFYGTTEETEKWYNAAIGEAKGNPVIWRRALAYHVRTGDIGFVVEQVPEAAAACPDEESFAALASEAALLRRLEERPAAEPFILAALENPENQEKALQALHVMDGIPHDDTRTMAIEFRKLAEQHPTFLTLKMQLVRLYASLNEHEDAANLASEAMLEFPDEIEPPLLASEAYAANEDWVNALNAAREWRRRSPGSPEAADVMIGAAQVRLSRSSDDVDAIAPYSAGSAEDPAQFAQMVASPARALIKADRPAEAAELLQPRLRDESQARMLWLQLAVFDLAEDEMAAEWLEQVASVIPEDSLEERLTLASAWYEMANRTDDPAYSERAQHLIKTMAERPDVDGRTLFALAVSEERNGNYAAAETTYKRALQLNPDLTVAKNNLSMRYVAEKKNLEDALQLAQEIVEAEPDNANYHDTLGQVYDAIGNLDAAIQALEKAAELQPGNRKWTDRLALLRERQREADLG